MILPPLAPKNQVALLAVITEIQSSTLSVDDLTGYIIRKREKPGGLRIEIDKMPVGMAGYAVALRECDLIGLSPILSPSQQLGTLVHELTHFIREDIPLLPRGKKTITYPTFIHRRDRHDLVTSKKRFFNYDDPLERETETLARIFVQYIRSKNNMLPEMFIDLMS
jgi:hypothetical protein